MLLVDVGLKLGDFSLEAAFSAPDGVTAVFGPSGSGKSSLISALAGSVRPQRGHISLNGEALFAAKTGLNAPMEKRGVGLVWQEARLFPHLTVGDNLTYGARRAAGRAVRAEFDAVVEVLAPADWTSARIEAWLDWAGETPLDLPDDLGASLTEIEPVLAGLLDGGPAAYAQRLAAVGLSGGVFDDDFIDSYIALKMTEVERFEMTPHPVEFDMYYSG